MSFATATPDAIDADRTSAASGVGIAEPNGFIEPLLFGYCSDQRTLNTDLRQVSL
jgi:hypothetical protein